MEFEVGDIIEAFGVKGTVIMEVPNTGYDLPLRVRFENGVHVNFARNGQTEIWHRSPCLKLIERPKKKVKKAVWFNCYKKHDSFTIGFGHASEELAIQGSRGCSGYLKTICVEVEVDEE